MKTIESHTSTGQSMNPLYNVSFLDCQTFRCLDTRIFSILMQFWPLRNWPEIWYQHWIIEIFPSSQAIKSRFICPKMYGEPWMQISKFICKSFKILILKTELSFSQVQFSLLPSNCVFFLNSANHSQSWKIFKIRYYYITNCCWRGFMDSQSRQFWLCNV